jgi:Metallo-peptidase family M12/Secretion system C-terminal sorting domain/Fibronectin type III domain
MKNLHVKMLFLGGILCMASTGLVSEAMAQPLRPVAQAVSDATHSIDFQAVTPFSVTQTVPASAGDLSKSLKNATFAVAPDLEISRLYERNLAGMRLSVPYQDEVITVEVLQVDALASDFKLLDQKGQVLPFKKGKFYRGMVLNDPNTLVSINLFENEINGIISTPQKGNLNFGKLKIAQNVQDYIVYSDRDLLVPFTFECATQTPPDYERVMQEALNAKVAIPVNELKCVRVGWEVTNPLHIALGNTVVASSNYITAAYNNMATLYVNDGIRTNLAQVMVWTTADNYTTNNTGTALDEFVANRPPSAGIDLLHLIAPLPANGGGGIAYVGILCHPTIRHAYSQVLTSYSAVPTYSWTVEVLTHEMGHNLGSPHTHDCLWPVTTTWTGGPLDNCRAVDHGPCAVGPAPTSGGTIMSYCHLIATGINFNNGFGTEPGNLIRARVAAATCLTPCNTVLTCCGTPSVFTATSGMNDATISWLGVTGATNYNFRYRAVGSGTWITVPPTALMPTPTMNLAGLTSGTTYEYEVQSVCSNGATDCPFSLTNRFGTCCTAPAPTASAVTSTGATISWAAVSGATSYNLRYRTGTGTWTNVHQTGISKVLTTLAPGTVYQFEVQSICSNFAIDCPYSATVTFTTLPNCCGTPTGFAVTPTVDGATISWTAVAGATSYNFRYRLASGGTVTNGSTTLTSITVTGLAAATAYQYQVQAVCNNLATNCPYSVAATFTTLAAPTCCGTPVSANFAATTGSTTATVSWSSVGGATSYIYHYRASGSTTWSADATTASATASFSLTGLTASTTYEFEIKSVCTNGATDCPFSSVGTFTTSVIAPTCCGTPAGFTVTPNSNGATITWGAVTGAASYNFQYRLSPLDPWIASNPTAATVTLTGLTAGTAYQYEVQAVCTNGVICPYSTTATFTTLPTCCGTPTGFVATPTINGATITWTAIVGASSYNFRYRALPTNPWITSNPMAATVTLTGLAALTNYQYEVQAVCGNLATDCSFSATSNFTTLPTCCGTPTGLTAVPTINGATITWGAVTGAASYNFRYRILPTDPWITSNPMVATVTLTGLTAGTAYQYEVQAVCTNGATNCPFTTTATFTTLPTCCGTPTGFTSTPSANGVTVTWGVVTGATSYLYHYRVSGGSWSSDASVTTATFSLTGLASSTGYEYEVKAVCSNLATNCGYSATQLFTTAAPAVCCGTPAGFSVTPNVTSATISWPAVVGASSYIFRYRVVGTLGGTPVPTATSTITITNLTPGTAYEFEARALCTNGATCPYSAIGNFTTLPTCCGTPTGFVTAPSINGATISWAVVTGATSYNFRYRLLPTDPWLTSNPTSPTVTLTGLTAGTAYQYEVQAVCSNLATNCPYSTTGNFTTLPTCCGTPTGFSVTPTITGATITWGAVTGATSYNFRYRILPTDPWIPSNPTAATVTLTGLTAATVYQYEVQAICSNGATNCPYTLTNHFTTLPTCCGTPSGFAVTPLAGGVTITWGTIGGATSYNFRYRAGTSGAWTPLNPMVATVTLTGLIGGTAYQYEVQAVCSNGATNCPYSTTGLFTPLATCCGTPAGFTSVPSANGATISWTPVSGATSYIFHYRIVGGSWSPNATASSPTFTVTGLNPTTTYEYEVQSVCSNGATNCPFSTTSTFTTTAVPTCCGTPSGFIINTTFNGVTISWTPVSGATSYKFRYRQVGVSGTAINSMTTATSVTLSSLLPGTTYEFQVQSVCGNFATDCPYSTIGTFTTNAAPACCGTPSVFTSPTLGTNTATLGWTAIVGAVSYNVHYRAGSTGAWLNLTTATNSIGLSGLTPNTSYQYEVQAVCSNGSTLCLYSATQTITTSSVATCCGTPSIFNSTVGTTTVNLSWNAITGAGSYNVRIRAGSTGGWTTFSTTTNSLGLAGLTAGTTYQYEVQSICTNGSTLCLYSATQTITTSTGSTCCGTPSVFSSTIGTTTVNLSWNAITGAGSYKVRIRVGSTGGWTNFTTGTNSIGLAGLTAGTTYQYEVQSICTNGSTLCQYSATQTITTSTGVICCGTATGLTTTNINPSTVSLTWTGVSGVSSYVIQLQSATAPGGTYTVGSTNVSFYNLVPNTTYQWQIRAVCANGAICWSSVASFTTSVACVDGNESPTNNSSSGARTMTLNTIYNGTMPNGDVDWFKITIPNSGTFNVLLSNLGNNYALELYASDATTLLATSNNTSINNESIVRNNSVANTLYYVKVRPSTASTFDAYTCYRLRCSMGSAMEYSPMLGEVIQLPNKTLLSSRIMEQPFEASVDLFPNPTTGNLVLRIETETKMILEPMVEITDMFGRVVQQTTFPAGQSIDNQYHLNLNGYQDGIYLVRVQLGNQVTTHKVRVQK